MIKDDIEAILVHSQDYPFDLNASTLVEKWAEAKAPLIKLFGGKTIWKSEKPIKVHLSQEQRSRKFNEFISTLDNEGILPDDLYMFLLDNQKDFFSNKVSAPNPSLNIKSGSKISRTFKKFFSDQETTRKAQDIASRYIQEDKIEGYLYLSVDPKDFLTLSENNLNWSSCQSLDGDYRSGNLSYMVDKVTLVAYLASETQEHLKPLPQDQVWNNKKWRMLVHTNQETCIYYDRQYPFTSETLLSATYEALNKLLQYKFYSPETIGFKTFCVGDETATLPLNQMTLGGRIFSADDILDTSDYRGFCDLIYSSTYVPIVSIEKESRDNYKQYFSMGFSTESVGAEYAAIKQILSLKIGDKVPCVCCGEGVLERENSFLCPICIAEHDADEDFFLKCSSCNRRIYDEDEVNFILDQTYCKDCFHEIEKEEG